MEPEVKVTYGDDIIFFLLIMYQQELLWDSFVPASATV